MTFLLWAARKASEIYTRFKRLKRFHRVYLKFTVECWSLIKTGCLLWTFHVQMYPPVRSHSDSNLTCIHVW